MKVTSTLNRPEWGNFRIPRRELKDLDYPRCPGEPLPPNPKKGVESCIIFRLLSRDRVESQEGS